MDLLLLCICLMILCISCYQNGLNALHLASKEGHVEIVSELIQRGVDVDAATKVCGFHLRYQISDPIDMFDTISLAFLTNL